MDANPYAPDEVVLGLNWRPEVLPQAMESLHELQRACAYCNSELGASKAPFDDFALELDVGSTRNGCWVGANYGNPVWDILEDGAAAARVCQAATADLHLWWEDRYNSRVMGQGITVFTGKDGPTLQCYQPFGNGLWIVGAREKRAQTWQMSCHNTDHPLQALSHVMALVFVLEEARKHASE